MSSKVSNNKLTGMLVEKRFMSVWNFFTAMPFFLRNSVLNVYPFFRSMSADLTPSDGPDVQHVARALAEEPLKRGDVFAEL